MTSGRRASAYACAMAPLVMAIVLGGHAEAQTDSLETEVKATFLYKFAAFVDWPGGGLSPPDGPVNLCVAGEDPFGPVLDEAVRGRTIGAHPIVVKRLQAVDHDSGCQILYVGAAKARAAADILRAVRGAPVLTVTDARREEGAKGIIHFKVKDNRVRFDIDDQQAAENGLGINSKLLNLALTVKPRVRG